MNETVAFPVRRRILDRLGLASGDRLAALDSELRRIESSISALKAVRASLLAEYREELRRGLTGAMALALGFAVALVFPCAERVNHAHCHEPLIWRQAADFKGQTPHPIFVEWRTEEIAWGDLERASEF